MQSVLVVDDDPAFRELMVNGLKTLPELDIHEAPGGGHALRLLGARPFDLVVLDLHMPLIDGFVVLRALRTRQGLNDKTAICVVTADESPETRARAMELGVSMYMTKPVIMTTALAIIDARLKRAARLALSEDSLPAAKKKS